MMMMMKTILSLIALLFTLANGLVAPVTSSSKMMTTAAAVTRDNLVMMPATLPKEKIRTAGPAVLDRPTTEKKSENPRKERSRTGGETWEVRIYNDGMNTREHVARSLVQVTGLSEMSAYQTMMRAHQDGIATVGKWCFEIAELYNEGLRKNGIISDIVPVDEER
mmetsp:Transcript_23455/g.57669  ORF Transcript_23455/g.57669 Transcript_23455/m.57669 type:complete len:165 (-) Transcript_23455:303-797(-)|eukprot:CAMPEP_0113619016 /NCGR_PEP_ID=MMETSP0017_2-20120614/9647_1 /TAXON_ID=2856 /ORGANISM="Cylindrotheca closterium" /LENGTH=164 /DNA_ID=CAMNT_0000528567 /DNA_START=178 /DNA_END=672 /DNA_ORIENTATION=+ /assembly_acc=CAM_ASM_000147